MKYSSRLHLMGAAVATAALTAGLVPLHAETLSIVMESRLSVLDPMVSLSHQTRNHGYMIYDTLLALDEDNEVQPQMVEEWTVSDDGKKYTFVLRDGLEWHDGAPVTAEDSVASIERWAQQDRMGKALMKIISGMEVEGDKTFSITLSSPTDLLLEAFAKPSGLPLFILPKRLAETPPTEPITDYTGSGPYTFVESLFEPGALVVYDKNEAYVPRSEPASALAGGKVVHVDRVERIEMADQLTSLNALTGGEIDYLETVPFDLLPMVEGQDGVVVEATDTIGYQPLYRFNHLHEPFNDKLVRQAAMHAIGQEELLQAQIGNPEFYQTCAAVFGCGLPHESSTLSDMVVPSNIEKARELLEEAGYDGAPVVILQATDIPMLASMPIVMAQQLREAGFSVQVQAMDFMTLLSRRSNRGPVDEGGWSIFVTSWHNTEVQDPLRSFTVTADGDDAWAGWPSVPAVVEAIDEYLAADDASARQEIAERIHTLVLEEGVSAPLGSVTKPTGYSSALKGVIHAPVQVFWNISKNGE